MGRKPIHVDMGAKFPMRFALRHHRDLFSSGAVLSTLFLFLPLAFFFTVPISLREFAGNWWMPILLVTGLGGAYLVVASLYDRVLYEIDGVRVRISFRQFLRGSVSKTAPLSEYIALLTSRGKQQGFIGEVPNYQITLFHGTERAKQVALFFGTKKELFEKRLQEYEALFALPVDPKNPGILEIKTG